MFEDLDAVAERLLATTRDQDDPFEPTLDPDGTRVDRLVTLARLVAAAEAESMLITAAMCHSAESWQDIHDPERSDRLGPEDLVAAEIAPALHLAPVTAAIRVDRAVQVVTRLPQSLRALRRGDLDQGRLRAIEDATDGLAPAEAGKVERAVLPRAVDQTAGELRAALRRAVITIDPVAAERRRKKAIKDRTVDRYQEKDGTSVLRAVLSAIDTGEIYDLIDEVARQTKTDDDTRPMDARRADAMVWLFLGRDPHLGPEDPPDPPAPDPDHPGDHPGDHPDDHPDDEPGDPSDTSPDQTGDAFLDEPADAVPGEPADAVADDTFRDEADACADPDDPGPVEPTHDEWDAPNPGEPDLTEQAGRAADLNSFDRAADDRTARISELAALDLSAMTQRRATRLPWVAINHLITETGARVEVGELQGYGPITANYAQHLLETGAARAPDAPSGRTPTRAQARTHDPPQWLANDVRARDGTCRFMGCKQPAHRVDLDHTISHPDGLTVRANLGGLCRRHHLVKHSGCWRVHQHHDGSYEWTSTITSRTYTTYPRGTTGEWRGTTTLASARTA